MTKISFIKGSKCIFTIGLTNSDLRFRVKGWGFGENIQILKNKK